MASSPRHPFVYWAQNKDRVFLRVDLKDAKEPDINVNDESIEFSSIGTGATGSHLYEFSILLHKQIVPQLGKYRVTDRQIDIELKKATHEKWPRLTASEIRYPWIKIDFDKWDSDKEEKDDVAGSTLDEGPYHLKDENFFNKKNRNQKILLSRNSFRKVYLTMYNLWQFLGFSYVMSVLVSRYLKDGNESFAGTYDATSHALKFCQLMQFLEILHPLFGYTKGGLGEAIVQVSGRFVILFGVISPEPRIQTKPVIFYLFFVWTLVELVRYPYYALRVHNAEVGIVTWLRYTIWIPLYPLGFLCEGIVILRCIPFYEETGNFSVSLPNSWNFAFHFPTLMRIYLLFFFLPAMYVMMSRMQSQRRAKLGNKKKVK